MSRVTGIWRPYRSMSDAGRLSRPWREHESQRGHAERLHTSISLAASLLEAACLDLISCPHRQPTRFRSVSNNHMSHEQRLPLALTSLHSRQLASYLPSPPTQADSA